MPRAACSQINLCCVAQALQLQEDLNVALKSTDDLHIESTSQNAAGKSGKEAQAAPSSDDQRTAAVVPHKKNKNHLVQYSRRPVPTAKQKQQAAQSQYLLEMKEYFAEVLSY